jgi:predicted acetyltransferase
LCNRLPDSHNRLDVHCAPLDLEIRQPALTDRAAFASWIADWQGDAYDPYRWIFAQAKTDFDWYVASCERMRSEGSPPELTVPLDAHWAFADAALVGELYLFYVPMAGDNHIGYKVRPSFRRKGIATALLRWGLDVLRERGITSARLCCRDTNLASAAVIERAGGARLEDKCGSEGQLLRRYIIPTHSDRAEAPVAGRVLT